jgi:UDP-N-acetylmuramoylalanine--D-glutamate ligase
MNLENIAILGLARSGIAAAYKLKELGFSPFLSEMRPKTEVPNSSELIRDFECEFGKHSERLFDYETIIVSPGIPLTSPIILELRRKKIELISEIEFGFRIKHKDSKIIAVTGSNGKSTTVSLIYHLLKTAGFHTILAGNIGTAFTSYPIEKSGIDYIVLELSSFQLDLIDTFQPNVAAILNITPDHLNRYENFAAYVKSKFSIFKNVTNKDIAIINGNDDVILNYSKELKINFEYFGLNKYSQFIYNKSIYHYDNITFSLQHSKLLGAHNAQNSMAAVLATAPIIQDSVIMQKAIDTFVPLPHRLEICRIKNGITFVNDSKATNTDSVKYALTSFSQPVRIIMGGSDKGEDFRILNPLLKKHTVKIYLIGETTSKMTETFQSVCPIEAFTNFKDCIYKAFQDSHSGDVVLLSPACASYDMFQNYEDRGNQFKTIVSEL